MISLVACVGRCLAHAEPNASSEETPSGRSIIVYSLLYMKQIKHIIEYQLFTNASN